MARSSYKSAYYEKNRERILEKNRAYHKKNRKAITDRNRERRHSDPSEMSRRREQNRRWEAANPDKMRAAIPRTVARARKRQHGVTLEMYEEMLASQGRRCAICRTDSPGRRTDWHLDHDHETKAIRGLLCSRCNLGIGLLRDDPHVVMAAATYLLTHKARGKVG